MEFINGLFLMIGTVAGILLGYAVFAYIKEQIAYKKYVKYFIERNPDDEIINEL